MRAISSLALMTVAAGALALPTAGAPAASPWATAANRICAQASANGTELVRATPENPSDAEFVELTRKVVVLHERTYARLARLRPSRSERARVAAALKAFKVAISRDKAAVREMEAKFDYETLAKWGFESAANWVKTKAAFRAAGSRKCARYAGATKTTP